MSEMPKKKRPTYTTFVKTEVRKILENGGSIVTVRRRFHISTEAAQNIIDEVEHEDQITEAKRAMRELELFEKAQSLKAKIKRESRQPALCKTCRWKPCIGAATCYRRVIDGES